MSATERNFNNFELGDNVYELADSLIPEIAEHLDFELGPEPSSDELYELVGKLGKNRVLGANEEVTAIDLETAADLLGRAGVQEAMDRSLWTPRLKATHIASENPNAGFTVITGAVPNWQDRTAKLVAEGISEGSLRGTTYVVTGNRTMGVEDLSEAEHPNVKTFQKEKGILPTETQYAERFVVPVIQAAGGEVALVSYETESGAELAHNFVRYTRTTGDKRSFERLFELGSRPITFARVANAGAQLAVQFRTAVRSGVVPESLMFL